MPFLALTMAAASAPAVSDPQSQSEAICSEICIMQNSQREIAELMTNKRPPWAITLFRNMDEYVACGERFFASEGAATFEDFAETDRLYAGAFEACAPERLAFTVLASAELLAEGFFATETEAIVNVERVRAMAFALAMVRKFGSTDREGAAEKYAEVRFPELVAAIRDRRARPKLVLEKSVPPPVPEAE